MPKTESLKFFTPKSAETYAISY